MTSSSPCSRATSSITPPPPSPSRPSTPSPATTSAQPATPTVPTPLSPIPVASSSAHDSSPFDVPPLPPVSPEILVNLEQVKAVEKSYLVLSASLPNVNRPLVERPVEKRSSATTKKLPAKSSKQSAAKSKKPRDRMSTGSPSKRKAKDVQEPNEEEQWEDVADEETQPEIKSKGKGKKIKTEPGSDDEKPAKRQRAAGGGRKWTGPELEALLSLALQGGPPQSAFNDGIPGRTAQQCSMTWRNTVLPYLKKCLHERGQNGGGKTVKDE